MTDGMNRRRFLKVLGATGGGVAALTGCGIGPEPVQPFTPYLVPPEDQIPGVPTWYASTCRECAAGCGVHVKVREGRAIKIEGNPESPINRGRLCARGQAALQGLYNPDRVTEPLQRNTAGHLEPVTWDQAIAALQAKVQQFRGQGVVVLTGLESGSFGELVDEWAQQVGARHLTYEPFAFEALRQGNRRAFNDPSLPWYDFEAAKYVVSFGADFMETWLSPVGFQHAFARAHSFDASRNPSMARFVYVGPRLPQTGLAADEWIALPPGGETALALAMAQVIVSRRLAPVPADVARLALPSPQDIGPSIGLDPAVIERLATEFVSSGAPLAVAGGIAAQDELGAEAVVAVNVLNYVAGAIGKTVQFGADLSAASSDTFQDVVALADDMKTGKVAVLLVHGANPVHSLGGGFAQAWGHVGYKVAFSSYLDETAAGADLVLPDLHPLEQWNDSRPRAGVHALLQPAMTPVYDGTMHAGDVLLRLMGQSGSFKEYLERKWQLLYQRLGRAQPFEQWWATALQHGGIFEDFTPRAVRLAGSLRLPAAPASPRAAETTTAVVFPHPALHDGRGANKPWLQELPDPISKITWHGWAEVHPDTALRWGVVDGDVVLVKSDFGAVSAPVWITPSVRPEVLALPTGQGHTAYGRYARDRSFNAFDLLSGTPNAYGGRTFAIAVSVQRTREHRDLASTAGDSRTLGPGEDIVKLLPVTQAQALKAGEHPFAEAETPPYADQAMEGWAEAQREKASLGNYVGERPRWAMAIDLAKCTGCSACVTACYAENNLATVGQDLVARHRQMSWMRIERYWRGGAGEEPLRGVVTPMLCQQCEQAPCEPVCPVFAAYHTPDGLNGQVYNRCVGTRYCSNNCPYKVRYFNWLNYAEPGGRWEAWPTPLDWQLNPDVTVREKGVMEKCTFCVQRIRAAQNQARLEDRPVRDGEIVPACAQTCPSEAIVFGDLHDPSSQIAKLAQHPRGYHVLEGLNTKPGITYLARVVHAAKV
jgi:anaerobic selenocysteine-containing dehydrogenase/Fe-S-cluster-containing dehydrogenase component